LQSWGQTAEGAKQAYLYFQKSSQYVPGYKEVTRLQKEAYERSIMNIMINPIQDEVYGGGWNNWNSDMRVRFMHEQLVRDTGRSLWKFRVSPIFTESDARRLNVSPDWWWISAGQSCRLPFNTERV
jgi:hypothetical protein